MKTVQFHLLAELLGRASTDVPIPTSLRCGLWIRAHSSTSRFVGPNIKLGMMRFSFGLIVNIWAATRKTTGSIPVQSHLIDV